MNQVTYITVYIWQAFMILPKFSYMEEACNQVTNSSH